jgi:hypothetical protein
LSEPKKAKRPLSGELFEHEFTVRWAVLSIRLAGPLERRDPHEVFTGLIEYARAERLGFEEMTRLVLGLYRKHLPSSKLMARWWREAPRALGENELSSQYVLAAAIRAHGRASKDWSFGKALEVLAPWDERINERFFEGALPPAIISFERTRSRTLGHFKIGHDGLGLLWRININPENFERPLADIIATLAHEKVHQWEQLLCGRWRAGGGYHTRVFQEKARELGIPSNGHGEYLGVTSGGPLARLLAEYGIDLRTASLDLEADKPVKRSHALAPWVCGCLSPVVWLARDSAISAVCQRCGQAFAKREVSR